MNSILLKPKEGLIAQRALSLHMTTCIFDTNLVHSYL